MDERTDRRFASARQDHARGQPVTPSVRLATYRSGPSFMALMSGRLALTDGVVTLQGAPIVWPAGSTEWDGERLTYGGRTYVVGDVVRVGGGGAPLHMVRACTRGLQVPEHWAEDDSVIIAN